MKLILFYAILLVAAIFTGECTNEKKKSTRNNNIKVQGNMIISKTEIRIKNYFEKLPK